MLMTHAQLAMSGLPPNITHLAIGVVIHGIHLCQNKFCSLVCDRLGEAFPSLQELSFFRGSPGSRAERVFIQRPGSGNRWDLSTVVPEHWKDVFRCSRVAPIG
jgi:hypothetical protein